jgi:hypothetical protein
MQYDTWGGQSDSATVRFSCRTTVRAVLRWPHSLVTCTCAPAILLHAHAHVLQPEHLVHVGHERGFHLGERGERSTARSSGQHAQQ